MEANIRVNVSGVSEAEQQLRNFSRAVSDVSRNAQQNVQGGSLNLEDVIKQVTQKVGGIDPFRSGRDFGKFSREVQESYINPLEQRKSLVSGELRGVESFRQTVAQQLKSGDISEEEYSKTLEELNKETEFYNNELQRVTDSLKSFGSILAEVGKINQEILSGERDAREAPSGTRGLGTLESLGLQRSRTEFQLQRSTDTAERNALAMESRESLKRVMDIRSEQMLTTNQRAVYTPAFQGATNVVSSIGGGVGGSFGEIVDTSMNFARDIREAFTLDLARAGGAVITGLANLVSSYARMTIPKMVELGTAKSETGLIGGTVSEGAYGLGMNATETNRALQAQYRSVGVGRADLGISAMSLESGAGVGVGGFSDLFQSFKYYAKDNQDLIGEVSKAVDILGKSGMINLSTGDFARMQEGSRLISQANSMQTGRFANVDVKRSASIVSGLEQLGGTFKGEAGMGKFQSIDEAMQNPKNDFIKATLFRALMAENPNMSMRDLEKRMEAGAFGEGNFNAFVKQIGTQSGVDTERATTEELLSNDMFVRNMKLATGQKSLADTETLISGGRSKGMGAFDIFDMKEGQNISEGLIGRGQNAIKIVRENKRLDDLLANQDGKVAETLIQQTRTLVETLSAWTKGLGDTLGKLLSNVGGIAGFKMPEKEVPLGDMTNIFGKEFLEEAKKQTNAIEDLNRSFKKNNQLNKGIKD